MAASVTVMLSRPQIEMASARVETAVWENPNGRFAFSISVLPYPRPNNFNHPVSTATTDPMSPYPNAPHSCYGTIPNKPDPIPAQPTEPLPANLE